MYVSVKDHPADSSYEQRDNEFDRYNWENYDPKMFQGAPISLQLVWKKWHCEKVMAALRKVELELAKYE